ncbi:hypothetical protein BpHYR1_032523 [Brachionus plicatilis]|uniref:Uncharacterized protein n=1 Tax=Brachionus plicatilis TaxID=10195 RepID=A0A3M7Q6J0_BRAPC|nr:hypothetical protein BpHYR1_032523 [Brachionus plicatilis]
MMRKQLRQFLSFKENSAKCQVYIDNLKKKKVIKIVIKKMEIGQTARSNNLPHPNPSYATDLMNEIKSCNRVNRFNPFGPHPVNCRRIIQ